eukprot:6195660-Pleurochrysis_carterae.AAC.3
MEVRTGLPGGATADVLVGCKAFDAHLQALGLRLARTGAHMWYTRAQLLNTSKARTLVEAQAQARTLPDSKARTREHKRKCTMVASASGSERGSVKAPKRYASA